MHQSQAFAWTMKPEHIDCHNEEIVIDKVNWGKRGRNEPTAVEAHI